MPIAPYSYSADQIKALIISEEPEENQRSMEKCLRLGYEVKSADSFERLSIVINTFFDIVLISRKLRAVGINYLSMNFKQSFHVGKKPIFLLIYDDMPNTLLDKELWDTGIIDGVFVVGQHK